MKKYLFIFILIHSFVFSQNDSTFHYKKNKITIPFELSNNLIILDAKLNNISIKLILDTGSEHNILFSLPSENDLEIFNVRKTSILGLGSKIPIEAIYSHQNNFKCGDYFDSNFNILIIDESQINIINKFGIEVNGIIGHSFFEDQCVEINYEKRKITLYKNDKVINSKKLKKYSQKEIKLINKKPFVKLISLIEEEKRNINLLIDSGLSDGLWLFENDSITIPKKHINDILGIGLTGDIIGKRSRIKTVEISEFDFKNCIVAYPDSLSIHNINSNNGRNGSLGGEIIKRFNWIFDYKNELVYLKKNIFFERDFLFNMSGIEVQHTGKEWIKEEIRLNSPLQQENLNHLIFENSDLKFNYKYTLKPSYEITYVRENSSAKVADIRIGDKIISINKRKAQNLTLEKISEIFQSGDGNEIQIEIQRSDQILLKIFKLEKVL